MTYPFLFLFGLAAGSFLNVVASRYKPGNRLFDPKVINGRSFCPECRKQLAWYELAPVLSFLWQRGRCRHCGDRISFQYPLVEILSGLIAVAVPAVLFNVYGVAYLSAAGENIAWFYAFSAIWILVFWACLLLSLIDFRHFIIPDQINAFIAGLGALFAAGQWYFGKFGFLNGSFLGSYSLMFGLRDNVWLNHLAAAFFAALFFGAIIYLSRGKGMGMGDLKLGAALGFLMGWPDIALALMLAFIVGAVFGVGLMILKKKGMKDFLPFGPFIVAGAALVFVGGYEIIRFYFTLFRL